MNKHFAPTLLAPLMLALAALAACDQKPAAPAVAAQAEHAFGVGALKDKIKLDGLVVKP